MDGETEDREVKKVVESGFKPKTYALYYTLMNKIYNIYPSNIISSNKKLKNYEKCED